MKRILLALALVSGLAMGQSIKFEFSNVRFRSGRAVLDPASYAALDSLARFLSASGARIEIAGHTDNRGGAAANRLLSQRRADAVRRRLITFNRVPAGQLAAKGYGQSLPRADNFTAEGRAQNRRVEISVLSAIRTARVSFLLGNAFIRKQGVSGWEQVQLGRVLTVMDELATDSTGRLEITFDNGSRIKLHPRSSVVLSQLALEEGGREPAVDIGLKLGRISAKVAKLQQKRDRFSVSTPAAVAGIRGTEFQMESRPDQAALLSVWEDAVLWRGTVEGSMDKPVSAGQGCRCFPGKMPEPPVDLPKPPMPQKPQANDTLYYNPDRPKPLVLAWQNQPGTRARVLVARDAELNDVVADVVTSDQSYQVPPPKADRLYWQLTSFDTLGFEGQPWPLRSFEVRRKLDGPKLNIIQPLPGQRIGRKTFYVLGSTDPNSTVAVNGVAVPLSPDHGFSHPLALQPGENSVNVTSSDQAGNVTAQTVAVTCAPFRRFWVGPQLGALKLLGGEWDMSTIGFSGGVRFLAGINERLSLGAQAGYGQVGCIYDAAFEPRGEQYQTSLLFGSLLAQACPMPDLVVAPYAGVFAGAASWTNEMDTITVRKDFGTPSPGQEDLSPHAGIFLGARYLVNESVLVFLEVDGGYLSTRKQNVGHYDVNNLTAVVQAGAMFGF